MVEVEAVIERSGSLSVNEKIERSTHEERIRRGLIAWTEAGQSLAFIRDNRLYRDEFSTFEEYVEAFWDQKRDWAYKLIGSSEVAKILHSHEYKPENKGQARSLIPLKNEPNKLISAWDSAIEDSKNGKPTELEVKAAVAKILPKRANVAEGDTPIVTGDRLSEYVGLPVTVLKVEGDRVKVEANGTQFTAFRTELIAQPKKTREQVLEDLLREVLMINVELPVELVKRIEGAIGL